MLRFAQPNDGAPPPQLVSWADEVGRLTDGSVVIEFENGWRIGEVGYEVGTLKDVRTGAVDLAWVGARAFDRLGVTSFQALLAPLLVDSHELQRAVFDEGIPEEMLAGVEELDLVGVGVLPGPLRKVLGVDAAFVEPVDFEGAVVGMQDSALAEQSFRALGARAKAVPSGAVLGGLDGYEQQLGSITGNGYHDQAEALSDNLNLWPRPLVIVAGRTVHAELDDEQQHALVEASRRVMVDALVGARNEDVESAAIVCDSPLAVETVPRAEMADFHEALEPVYSSLRRNPTTARFLERIEALKRSVGAGPDTAGCGGPRETAGAIPNGTYRHTVTRADVEEHCRPGDPGAAAFSGLSKEGLTLQIDVTGERIVQSQFPTGQPGANEIGSTGTYRTHRDTLELVETGYSEGWSMTCSYDDGSLQLEGHASSCDAEIVWTSDPWVKVADRP